MGKQSRRNKAAKPKKSRIKFVNRPFEGLPFESDLVAMREIIPSATLPVRTTADHGAADLIIVTLLPGMAPAIRRQDGVLLVAAQTIQASGDISLDIADRILKGLELADGETLNSPELPDADALRLQDILDLDFDTEMELHDDFAYWVSDDDAADPQVQQAIQQSGDQMVPTAEVPGTEGAFWCRMQREFVRWVRPEDENAVLDGLARLQNKRELSFDDARFVGAFRALGLLIPVFELERGTEAEELEAPMAKFQEALQAAIDSTEPLTPEERRARQGIISRQVTLR